MPKTDLRILASAVAIAAWLVLLATGWALGGLVHLLLVGAVLLAPWSALPPSTAKVVDRPEQSVGQGGDRKTDQKSVLGEETADAVEDEAGD